MTRKNIKGVVGKKIPTSKNREDTGVGISFTQDGLSDGNEIELAIRKKEKKQGL